MEDNLNPETDNLDPTTEAEVTTEATEVSNGGKWYDTFNEDIRNHPGMEKFDTAEKMAGSYFELEKMVGAKGVIKPKEDASEEEVNKYYAELGRPEKSEDYELNIKEGLHPKITKDMEAQKPFRDVVYKAGLDGKQAQVVYDGMLDILSNAGFQHEEGMEKSFKEAETKMRGEWGQTYDEKMGAAQNVLDKYGSPELKSYLEDSGVGNNPHLAKLLAGIGQDMSEDSIGTKGSSSLTSTPDEAKAEIAALTSTGPKGAWQDQFHPEHDAVMRRLSHLYPMAHPESKEA